MAKKTDEKKPPAEKTTPAEKKTPDEKKADEAADPAVHIGILAPDTTPGRVLHFGKGLRCEHLRLLPDFRVRFDGVTDSYEITDEYGEVIDIGPVLELHNLVDDEPLLDFTHKRPVTLADWNEHVARGVTEIEG